MRKIAKLGAVSASALFAVMMTPSVSHATITDTLVNNWNWKCLEVDNSSTSNGARVQMWDCGNQGGAQWRITDGDGTWRQIVNVNSGKCLEIADSRTDNGAPAQQWSCSSSATMQWTLWNSYIINRNSGKVLEIDNGSDSNGARVQQWDRANLKWQNWSTGRNH